MVVYIERGYGAVEGHFLVRTITIFSSVCLGLFIAACGVLWGVYSDQSGHDEAIFRVEKEPGSVQDPER